MQNDKNCQGNLCPGLTGKHLAKVGNFFSSRFLLGTLNVLKVTIDAHSMVEIGKRLRRPVHGITSFLQNSPEKESKLVLGDKLHTL